MALPQPASRHALGLLRFPDPKCDWVVVLVASLSAPLALPQLRERLSALHASVPMIGARLHKETWYPGTPAEPLVVEDEPLNDRRADAAFELSSGAPLRLMLGSDFRRLAVAGHHAAFDGLALVAVLRALLGGPLPSPVQSPPPGPPARKMSFVRRLIRSADRVAPSGDSPTRDTYLTTEFHLSGGDVTARLAEACVMAVSEHNRRSSAPWRRVGISVAKGGPSGVGNVATYRRVDLQAGEAVRPAVSAALASRFEPPEQTRAGMALTLARPVVGRLSDSLLVSNLGRLDLVGAERLDFYPVARGRSAVSFGAATVANGASTLSVRARDLNPDDCNALLSAAVANLSSVVK